MNPPTMLHGAVAKVYVLKSSDGDLFEVEEAVAVQSLTLKRLIEDDCAQSPIPLLNVSGNILTKVLEYCKRHAEAPVHGNGAADDGRLKEFDAEFVNVDQAMLFQIIKAANYLEIKGLLDLLCQAIANMIKCKTVEEVRTIFDIKNDFTPEEEEAIRKQNHWAFG